MTRLSKDRTNPGLQVIGGATLRIPCAAEGDQKQMTIDQTKREPAGEPTADDVRSPLRDHHPWLATISLGIVALTAILLVTRASDVAEILSLAVALSGLVPGVLQFRAGRRRGDIHPRRKRRPTSSTLIPRLLTTWGPSARACPQDP
jgi:hypothetical protein